LTVFEDTEEPAMAESNRYHYTECGLDDVYLLSGFEYIATPRGRSVRIHDLEGLHRAIGTVLVRDRQSLNGREFRFLRHELNQTQAGLAATLGVNVQSVARWEKGQTKDPIDGPAQRLLRLLYREYIDENKDIAQPLKELAELDEMFSEAEDEFGYEEKEGWQPSLAA
jgi:DNA-binding transcriptional regulator YiaG